jgi:hypothetical protein
VLVEALAAGGLDLAQRLGAAVVVEVADRELRAPLGEGERADATEALRGAGDPARPCRESRTSALSRRSDVVGAVEPGASGSVTEQVSW